MWFSFFVRKTEAAVEEELAGPEIWCVEPSYVRPCRVRAYPRAREEWPRQCQVAGKVTGAPQGKGHRPVTRVGSRLGMWTGDADPVRTLYK